MTDRGSYLCPRGSCGDPGTTSGVGRPSHLAGHRRSSALTLRAAARSAVRGHRLSSEAGPNGRVHHRGMTGPAAGGSHGGPAAAVRAA